MLASSELEYTRFLERIEALKNELPEPFRSRLESHIETLEKWKIDVYELVGEIEVLNCVIKSHEYDIMSLKRELKDLTNPETKENSDPF